MIYLARRCALPRIYLRSFPTRAESMIPCNREMYRDTLRTLASSARAINKPLPKCATEPYRFSAFLRAIASSSSSSSSQRDATSTRFLALPPRKTRPARKDAERRRRRRRIEQEGLERKFARRSCASFEAATPRGMREVDRGLVVRAERTERAMKYDSAILDANHRPTFLEASAAT